MADGVMTTNELPAFPTDDDVTDSVQAPENGEAADAAADMQPEQGLDNGMTANDNAQADDAPEEREQEEEVADPTAITAATANGDFGDSDSELSDLDEEQFKDFDGSRQQTATGEPAVYNLPSFKKRKDKVRKRRDSRGSSDGDVGKIYSDDEARPTKQKGKKVPPRPEDPVAAAAWDLDRMIDKSIAPTKKRLKKDEEEIAAAMDDEIITLTERMRLAAQKDAEANAEKRVASAKLKMLPEVEKILRSQMLYDSILDNNMLTSVRHWLEPLPDRSLPALNIQRVLFDALLRLPIKTDHLRESGVGKIVLFYKKSKKPEESIRLIADRLVAEWSRPIIKKSANHRTKQVQDAIFTGERPTHQSSQSKQSAQREFKSKGGTSIPRGERAYEIAPVRQQELRPMMPRGGDGDSLRKMKRTLKTLGSKSGSSGKAKSNVSIEGRGIA